MREGRVQEVGAKVTGKSRPAPQGMWVVELRFIASTLFLERRKIKQMCEMYLPKINEMKLR